MLALLRWGCAAAAASGLAPQNPRLACERYINPTSVESCQREAKTRDLDWYGASICAQMEADDAFANCWKSIDGKVFATKALANCAESANNDDERKACLKLHVAVTNRQGRVPASRPPSVPGEFQDLHLSPRRK